MSLSCNRTRSMVVVVVIVWQLDLQLPKKHVPITTDVVSSNLYQFPPVSSTNKTDHYDITEILLEVILNTIKPTSQTNV